MLSELLPGFRDFRMQAIAGLFWAISFTMILDWLGWTERVLGGVRSSLDNLGWLADPLGVTLLVVAAYLLGVALSFANLGYLCRLGRDARRDWPGFWVRTRHSLKSGAWGGPRASADESTTQYRYRSDVRPPEPPYKPEDEPALTSRLKALSDTRFAEFDRLRAEAEFRSAVAVPLAAVTTVLAARCSSDLAEWAPWILGPLAAVLTSSAFEYFARRKRRDAIEYLIEANQSLAEPPAGR